MSNSRISAFVAAATAISMISGGTALATPKHDGIRHANGNNGSIKVHEMGTPSGTESNDPKVCSFNLEGYGFDAGQDGYATFTVQGGDRPTGKNAGPFAFGPVDDTGYTETRYFSLESGHYKITLYGKDTAGNVDYDNEFKAKSKVFKVNCPSREEVTPVTPVEEKKPDEKKGDNGRGHQPVTIPKTPKEDDKPEHKPAPEAEKTHTPVTQAEVKQAPMSVGSVVPAELPKTGTGENLFGIVAAMGSLSTYAGVFTARSRKSRQ